ncbi:MAG: helix-turn-helix transcriptional regulator, partial [Rhizobacter sp.]
PLSDTLAQLHRHAHVQRLLLGGFSLAETAEFVAAAAGTASSGLAATLYDQTEGHPLFLAELARDLVRDGDAEAGHGPTVDAGVHAATRRVPKGVRDVIGARLNRLTPACVLALQNAAVIGREFGFHLLCRLADDMPEEQGLAVMEEARAASLVEESSEPGAYQFTHALVRDTLYDELPSLQRARLHQRIAAALELQHAGDLTPCLSALAHHWHAAGPVGDVAKAIEYATRAAERATAMQAHEEAARHYGLACAALADGPAADAARGGLLLALGSAQNSAGRSALALATFADAAACARRTGDASLLARAAIGFGNVQWRLGIEGSAAVALIREALVRVGETDPRQRAALLTVLCRALLFSNQPNEAEAAYRDAVAIARPSGDAWTLFSALSAILPGRWFPDRLALRIEAARQAIQVAESAGHPEWSAPYVSGWYFGDLMELGDTAAAMATARFHLATSGTRGEPFMGAVALAALSMIAAHEGRFAEAESLAVQALGCGNRFDRANAAGMFGVQMFTIRRQQGRLRELAPVLRQFLDSESSAATWLPGLAVLHCELGSRDEAHEAFEKLAAGGFAGIANDAIRIASLAYLAEVCAWLGDRARAAPLFELLLPYAERNIVFGAHTASFGAAARLLGMLAATLERWDVAQHHFEHAVDLDARTGGRPGLARSRCEFAAMLLRRAGPGDHPRALALIAAALDAARELGMRSLEERAVELQQQLTRGRRQEVRIAGLSDREVQVLRLVAEGRTNQQIAAALCRSPSTVAIHVRNILGKTQAANRAEAAAFAVRHGLLPRP